MELTPFKKEEIEGYDCRFATYCRSTNDYSDILVVKEYIQLIDGRRIPNIRCIKDFKRDFWVTKEGYRNHKDKKEFELESRLQKYTCRQSDLTFTVAKALGMPGVKLPLRQLASSPYLYGTDISPVSLVKKQYQDRWPKCIGPKASVAVMDIETDVLYGTNDIIVMTLSFKDRIVTAINQSFVQGMVDPIGAVYAAFDKYLGEYKEKRNITLEVYIGETPAHCCKLIMEKAHQWMPDFVVFWNINFDMPRIIQALVKEQSILEDVFSDPKVPHEYRHFKYIEGPAQKKMQSGKIVPLHPADRWHVVKCPSSFYFLDAMCLYKRLRTAKGQEPSYSLESVLNRNLNIGKLKFDALEGVSKLEWHQQMQKLYKAEYVAYNIFDCIGVELLDEKNGDVSQAFPALAELADYGDFKSTPRRIVTDLHFFLKEQGYIIASCGNDVTEELDDRVVDMVDWILTLPAHMPDDNGVPLIHELDTVRTFIRAMNADLDLEGTYPNIEVLENISRETTMRELSTIGGLSMNQQRAFGINLTGGTTNAVELCQSAFGLPTPDVWLNAYKEKNTCQ